MEEERIERPGVPDDGMPAGSLRNLAAVLAEDLNTVTVTVVSAVAGAYGIRKVLGRGPYGNATKEDQDRGQEPPDAITPP